MCERVAFFNLAHLKLSEIQQQSGHDDDQVYGDYVDCWERWSARILSRLILVLDLEADHIVENSQVAAVETNSQVALDIMINWLAVCLVEHGHDGRMESLMVAICRTLGIRSDRLQREISEGIIFKLERGSNESGEESSSSSHQERNKKKWLMTGVGAAVGGTLMAVTAGLAAPIVLPSLALFLGMSAGTAAILGGATAAALTGVLFGAAGAGLAGFKMNRRWGLIGDFAFVPIRPHPHTLCLDLCISGWLHEPADVYRPWMNGLRINERWALRWEQSVLISLGNALGRFLTSSAASTATTAILAQTTLSAAMGALAFPITILQLGDLIDNPWSMAFDRAKQAGELLAKEVLAKHIHGHRPVNLYGFSLGSRVILSCLDTLIEMTGEEADVFGLIGNVILLGTPDIFEPVRWQRYRWLIGGRLIHGYSRNDWILSFLFRSLNPTSSSHIVGLAPIGQIDGIESIDLSDLVKGHLDYLRCLPEILELLCL